MSSTSMIKVIESRRKILRDFLSVPKTIGKGPMITAPPPSNLPFPLAVVKNMRITAKKAMINPAKTKIAPKLKNSWSLIYNVTSLDVYK